MTRSHALFAVFFLLILQACTRNLETDLDSMAKGVVFEYEYRDPEHVVFKTRNRDLKTFLTNSNLILKDFKKKYSPEYDKTAEITIQAVTDLENMAGESRKNEPILEISWQRRHIDQINFKEKTNITLQQVVDKIDQVQSFNLAGDLVLSDHCMSINSSNLDQIFCGFALRGLYNQ